MAAASVSLPVESSARRQWSPPVEVPFQDLPPTDQLQPPLSEAFPAQPTNPQPPAPRPTALPVPNPLWRPQTSEVNVPQPQLPAGQVSSRRNWTESAAFPQVGLADGQAIPAQDVVTPLPSTELHPPLSPSNTLPPGETSSRRNWTDSGTISQPIRLVRPENR
jgi:hypothetical protein